MFSWIVHSALKYICVSGSRSKGYKHWKSNSLTDLLKSEKKNRNNKKAFSDYVNNILLLYQKRDQKSSYFDHKHIQLKRVLNCSNENLTKEIQKKTTKSKNGKKSGTLKLFIWRESSSSCTRIEFRFNASFICQHVNILNRKKRVQNWELCISRTS